MWKRNGHTVANHEVVDPRQRSRVPAVSQILAQRIAAIREPASWLR